MTETNNWELYSSEEEVEQKQNHKKITDHKNLPHLEAARNEKETEFLERYRNLAGNALDESEILEIIRENNFNDKKIREIIDESVKYFKTKGPDYGWKEVKKDKKTFQVPETKPHYIVEGFRDNQTSQAGPYKKQYQVTDYSDKKGSASRENKFDNYDINYNSKTYNTYDRSSKYDKSYYGYNQYQDHSYSKQYNKNPKQKSFHQPYKKKYYKGDIFSQVMEDTQRREKQTNETEENKPETKEEEVEVTLGEIDKLNLSKITEEIPILKNLDEKSENKDRSFQIDKIEAENQIVKQSFTIGGEEKPDEENTRISEISHEILEQDAERQHKMKSQINAQDRIPPQFIPNNMQPSGSEFQPNPNSNFNPFMYGQYQNMPQYNIPPWYYNRNYQPTMEQMAQMYYYQMLWQQYANQMYSQNYPPDQNMFKK